MAPWVWIVFVSVLLIIVGMDLGLFARAPRGQGADGGQGAGRKRSAAVSMGVWLGAAAAFAGVLYLVYEGRLPVISDALTAAGAVSGPAAGGPTAGAPPGAPESGVDAMLEFVTGLTVELVLSLDNLAVLALLFAFYRVPPEMVARVLFVGVLASLALRLAMILLGGWALASADWVVYLMGGVLVVAALRVLFMPDERTDFSRRPLTRWLGRLAPNAGQPPDGGGTSAGAAMAGGASLLTVALAAGVTDMAYAVDSIPAVLSITRDPFIAFAANAFAILMLRSLYAALHGVVGRFRYLRVSVVLVLCFLASKYFLGSWSSAATEVSLVVVALLMALGIGGSLLHSWASRRSGAPAIAGAAGAPSDPDGTRPPAIEDLADVVELAQANLWKFVVLVVGLSVAVFGAIVVGPLPGPGGVLVVAAGLGILATEFVWAQRLLRELRRKAEQISKTTDRVAAQTPRWVVVPIVLGYLAFFALLWLAVKRFDIRWIPELLIIFTAFGGLFPLGFWVYRTLRPRPRVERPDTSLGKARDSVPSTGDNQSPSA